MSWSFCSRRRNRKCEGWRALAAVFVDSCGQTCSFSSFRQTRDKNDRGTQLHGRKGSFDLHLRATQRRLTHIRCKNVGPNDKNSLILSCQVQYLPLEWEFSPLFFIKFVRARTNFKTYLIVNCMFVCFLSYKILTSLVDNLTHQLKTKWNILYLRKNVQILILSPDLWQVKPQQQE